MAIANLQETILSYKMRRDQLTIEISELQSQKTLQLYAQGDATTLQNAEKTSIRKFFKDLYDNDKDLQAKYTDYTEMPDYEEEINKIEAEFQKKLAELAAWETDISNRITVDNAELEEINAYLESMKSMLTGNIQEDFNFGFNQ